MMSNGIPLPWLEDPWLAPWWFAIPAALIATTLIGFLQGTIITQLNVPAFVVTLAGFLAWNGVVLIILGTGGMIFVSDPVVTGIANSYLPPVGGWIFAAAAVGLYAALELWTYRYRRRQNLTAKPLSVIAFQVAGLAAISAVVVYVCNLDRGVPGVGIILLVLLVALTFVANRTPYGRYVYAVGGNPEAARRAGVNVKLIRTMVFTIAGLMAGMGGIILVSRLRSVSTNAGGGDLLLNSIAAAVIGGTSLFGGRGFVGSAVLGALVIASVENGMGLQGYSSGNKFVVTGVVLLIAVVVDSLSRRRQERSGVA
jgi:D-xylose transport system permease protein